MAETVVFYTSMGVGHLAPITELAKLLLHRHGLAAAATVVYVEPPFHSPSAVSFASGVSTVNPSITFHTIPAADVEYAMPPKPAVGSNWPVKTFAYLAAANANLRRYLLSGAAGSNSTVRALVVDFFSADAVAVAAELGIPSYIFFTCSVSCLATYLHLDSLRGDIAAGEASVGVPGLPPIQVSHLPDRVGEEMTQEILDFLFDLIG